MLGSELLRGERLLLTALGRDNAATVATWYADAEFLRMYDAMAAFPKGEKEIVARIEEAAKSDRTFLFGLRTAADGALIGQAAIESILWTHRVGWLSIALGPGHWGQGFGTEAMRLLLPYAFGELNLYRLQLTVFDYNARALALYARFGFRREGVFRRFLLRDGERHDMLLMGLLADEWREGRVE